VTSSFPFSLGLPEPYAGTNIYCETAPIGAVFEGRPSLSIAILAAIHSRDDFRVSPRSKTLRARWTVRPFTISPAISCEAAQICARWLLPTGCVRLVRREFISSTRFLTRPF